MTLHCGWAKNVATDGGWRANIIWLMPWRVPVGAKVEFVPYTQILGYQLPQGLFGGCSTFMILLLTFTSNLSFYLLSQPSLFIQVLFFGSVRSSLCIQEPALVWGKAIFSFHLFQCRCVTTVVMNHYNIIDATHAMLSTHATTKQQTNNQTNNRRRPLQPLTLCWQTM